MAAPERITRARALLAFRLLDKVLAEAAEAGKVPPAGSRWLDGDTAENARALFTWFSQQPEVKAAARNVADPDHAMIQYVRSVLEHFAFDRPQTAGGDPTPWREPVSSSLVRWAAGLSDGVAPADLDHPHEGAELARFGEARADLRRSPAEGGADPALFQATVHDGLCTRQRTGGRASRTSRGHRG